MTADSAYLGAADALGRALDVGRQAEERGPVVLGEPLDDTSVILKLAPGHMGLIPLGQRPTEGSHRCTNMLIG